jgi:hypothetical protein
MKRHSLPLIIILSVILGPALAFGINADAKRTQPNKPKESKANAPRYLALGLSTGVISDMSGLGNAITNGGMIPLNSNSLASASGVGKLFMSDRDAALRAYSAEGPNAVPLQAIADFGEGGPLIGIDIGLYAMYHSRQHLELPFFARLGFDYAFKASGGQQKLTLGAGPDQLATSSNYANPPFGFEGGSISTTWNASWMELPLTLGVTLPVYDLGRVYGGLGLSWFSGGFSIQVATDKKYAAYLTSYNTNKYSDASALMVTQKVKDTMEFSTKGIAINMLLGFEVLIIEHLAATVEYWSSGFAQTVSTTSNVKEGTSRVLTMATAGPDKASKDAQYIQRLTHPVTLGGTMLKFGLRYYLL